MWKVAIVWWLTWKKYRDAEKLIRGLNVKNSCSLRTKEEVIPLYIYKERKKARLNWPYSVTLIFKATMSSA